MFSCRNEFAVGWTGSSRPPVMVWLLSNVFIPKKKPSHWMKELFYGVGRKANEACKNICTGRCHSVWMCSPSPAAGHHCLRTLGLERHCVWPLWKEMVHLLSFPLNSQHFNDCPAVSYHLWWLMPLYPESLTLWAHTFLVWLAPSLQMKWLTVMRTASGPNHWSFGENYAPYNLDQSVKMQICR